jgi:dipeptidyl aminopeptidase/acylaminoacyl peptidase
VRTAFIIGLVVAPALAAQAPKRPLTPADWDRWRSITGTTISADGRWVAYTLRPQAGDGEFVVRATSAPTEYRIPLGYIARPNNTPGGARGGGAGGGGRGGGAASLTSDGHFAIATTQVGQSEFERLEKAQRAARGGASNGGGRAAGRGSATTAISDSLNRTSLVILSLANGQQTTIENVRNFRLPRFGSEWMIYTPGTSDTTANRGADSAGGRGGGRGGRGNGAAPAGPRRSFGNPVVLRRLGTGAEDTLRDVLAYTFDDSARTLAYTVASRTDSTTDGVYLRNLGTGAVRTVMSGQGNYRGFTFDRDQRQFVFTSDRDTFGKPDAKVTLYYGTVKTGTVAPLVDSTALPAGMRLTESGGAAFTRSGNAVLISIAPPPFDTIPADSLVGKATFDLWHWKDPELQPQQLLQVGRARNPTFQAIVNLTTRKVVRLTSDSIPSVSLSDDGRVGMASSSERYDIEKMWGGDGNDIYVVDPATGADRRIAEKISGTAQLSVDGRYIIWFNEGHWYSYAIATGKTVNLTGGLTDVHFEQETWSTPDTPSPWGVAGWTKGDKSVLLYDRFDIWELDPAGVRPATVVTDSLGQREHLALRLLTLGRRDERWIDPSQPLFLRAFDEDTKASGFYRDRLGVRQPPEQVVMDTVSYGVPQKADDADMYVVTKGTFVEFPNLWVGPGLTSLTRISDANPWQRDYNWGTAELVTWLSADGVPLQGILYKPENFDSTKKYPMISYFYEELSDGLYSYVPPNGRNVINPTHYVSNGYLVFEPDIHYEIGYPGPSAVKSIVPGVEMLLRRGYVDPKGLGLQGQSWGGYQTAYLITQTSMFSAAMAGAPVADMFSAYGGIRWGSGLARAFQYEKTQSRIGKSIWDAPMLYMENSPLFWLPRVTTPLFIMSNDKDDAVPWYQGIELFVGMRRLGKEAYLIDYNDDVHNPASRANQKDIALKMQQFFDAKLKGMPAPDWMVHGIPAKEKGRDQIAPAPAAAPTAAAAPGGGR